MTPSRHRLFAGLLAAFTAWTAASTAHAASATASATVYDLSFTLIDLDTADGIAPSLTFTYPSTAMDTVGFGSVDTFTRTSSRAELRDARDYGMARDDLAFVLPGSAVAAAGGGQATASSTLTSFSATASARLTGDPLSTIDFNLVSAFVCPKEACYGSQSFTLSPRTQLLMQGKYTLSGSVDATGSERDFVELVLNLNVRFNSGGTGPTQVGSSSEYLYLSGSAANRQSDALSGSFAFTFTNGGPKPGVGMFQHTMLSAYAAVTTASPVPEAHALVMALAGASVAGLARAQRRRPQAQV